MKASAASGASTARKPASGAAKSAAGNNGNASKPAASTTSAAANKKKTAEKGKTNGKDTAAPPSAWGSAPPGFAAPKQPQVGFSDHHQRVLRHRALFAFRFLVGKAVEVQLDDASVYAGVLDCIDPDDFSIVLKNTRRKSESGEAFQSGSTVIFKRQQIVHLSADGVVNYNEGALGAAAVSAAARGFRTDTEISSRQHDHLFGRELQSANSWLDPKLDIGELEDPRHRSSKPGWNQFEANEKLFGVVSSYDENIYTTKLDKSKISTHQSREAERIALEIERQTSTNFHLQEERGHQSAHHDNNLDEEARYSSVDRKHANAPSSTTTRGQNAYVPPALRNSQRQTSGGKAQPKAEAPAQQQPKSASTTSPPASSASPAAAPAPVSAPVVATPKPLSFSDAVTGRSSAVSTKPEPKKAASPKKPAAPATTTIAQMNGKEAKAADAKPAAAAAAPTSPEKKKASGSSTSAATTSSSASTTKETKSTPSKDKDTKTKPATLSSENNGKAVKSSTAATPAASATPATPAKKALNPNAKEFKFNVAAAEFTPKLVQPAAAPVATHSSPYHGAAHHHHQQHMGVHMHHQPHPGMVYPPMQEEWMYDSLVGMDEAELLPQGYMAYGMPMVPNAAVMQPHMYPQMVPQQNMRMMGGGGQRPHGGGYGYQQPPPYNPRGYYPQHNGGVPGGMPYPGAVPVSVAPQPPLPREPTPNEVAAPPASSAGSGSRKPSSMMLPPIRKSSSNVPLHVSTLGNPAGAGGYPVSSLPSTGKRDEEPTGTEKPFRDELSYSSSSSSPSSASTGFVMDRIHSLEKENELMRVELAHLRQHLSNNHQQREDEKVARLGHTVESVELSVKTLEGSTRRKLELHEQQLQYSMPFKGQPQASQRPEEIRRAKCVQQQMDEVQHSLALLKNTVTQVRTEVEADRNERWKNENERNQWIADLRAAVAKIDASMDAKIIHHVDRLNAKLMADKMDMMRLLEEYRELMTGADFKRISSQMLEFSRINDHLLALERWIHTEFGHIKRVCQFILADTDARLQTLALEVLSGMKTWHMVLLHQDDDHRTRLEDINNAVDEVARVMQTRLFALEDAVPMEVKARQQSNDKLRYRVESVIKSLSRAIETTREECVAPHVQLKSRMANLEEAQRQILDQVDEKQEIVKETMQEFVKDSDAMLRKLADYVEHKRQQTMISAAITPISNTTENAEVPVILAPTRGLGVDSAPEESSAATAENSGNVAAPTLSTEMLAEMRSEWVQFFETQLPTHLTDLKYALFDDVEEKFAKCMEKSGLHEQLQGLQTWTTSHAQECRTCYEYLTWTMESATCDNAVASCLTGMIDQVVESTARDEIQWLKDQSAWSMEQLAFLASQIRQQPQQIPYQQHAQSAFTPSIGRTHDADETHENDDVMRGPSPAVGALVACDTGEVPGREDGDAADEDRWL